MLNWTAPGALWLLAAVPFIWLAPLVARTTFNPRQRVLQGAARSLLLGALALAIARPVLSTNAPRQSIVYAVDVSHSIATHSIEDAARIIDEYQRDVHPSSSRIIVFGSNTATLAGHRGAPSSGADRFGRAAGRSIGIRSGGSAQRCTWPARARFDSADRAVQRRPADRRQRRECDRAVQGCAHPSLRRTDGRAFAGDTLDRSASTCRNASPPARRLRRRHRGRAARHVGHADRCGQTTRLWRRERSRCLSRTHAGCGRRTDRYGRRHVIRGSAVRFAVIPSRPTTPSSRVAEVRPRTRVLYVEGVPQSARYLASALREPASTCP